MFWELVYENENPFEILERKAIFGGWITRHKHKNPDGPVYAIGFIPDPEHKWELSNEEIDKSKKRYNRIRFAK